MDYYTRLEQGRVRASAPVLATLVRALRLDDDQQSCLYELAGRSDARPRRQPPQRVRPAMRRLLDQHNQTPALVLGKRLDILAWNTAATALYTDFGTLPAIRAMQHDWAHSARDAVAALRTEAAADPDDPQLTHLVGTLTIQNPDFRTWGGRSGARRRRPVRLGKDNITRDTGTFNARIEAAG
ncbi:hypothetical protein [Streptomyces sp. NPDC050738]|uniref:MmyB family transcriptional regulator n=1 Tax=Streptomyces sp. NPDC050738 TaxID=3154744 RepID=UPI0034215889